jgi:hypothetical protein
MHHATSPLDSNDACPKFVQRTIGPFQSFAVSTGSQSSESQPITEIASERI